MLKKLGFPSLYTRMIDVNLNGNFYRAIFQEDATKEFLERNNLTETVILKKNDFDFYLKANEKKIYKNFFSSSFVIDNNNFLKNDMANFIASEAISLKSNINFNDQVVNENFFKYINQKYASHGLNDINRKYIYLPYKKAFLPLYYDGNVQFLPGKTDCKNKIENKVITEFKKNYKDLTKKNLTQMQECIFKDVYNLSLNNMGKFENFFLSKDYSKKKIKKYSDIKEKIILYFKNKNITKNSNISNMEEKLMIYTFVYNDKFFNCYLSVENNNLISCNEIDGKKYRKYISESGRYKIIDNFKSFPINLGTLNKEKPIIKLMGNTNEFYMDKDATYHFVKTEKSNQDLKFIFRNNKSKLFIQGNFDNVNFDFIKDFYAKDIKGENTRYDKNLLTGCVNFFNTKGAPPPW